jgi:hypothetical protein
LEEIKKRRLVCDAWQHLQWLGRSSSCAAIVIEVSNQLCWTCRLDVLPDQSPCTYNSSPISPNCGPVCGMATLLVCGRLRVADPLESRLGANNRELPLYSCEAVRALKVQAIRASRRPCARAGRFCGQTRSASSGRPSSSEPTRRSNDEYRNAKKNLAVDGSSGVIFDRSGQSYVPVYVGFAPKEDLRLGATGRSALR